MTFIAIIMILSHKLDFLSHNSDFLPHNYHVSCPNYLIYQTMIFNVLEMGFCNNVPMLWLPVISGVSFVINLRLWTNLLNGGIIASVLRVYIYYLLLYLHNA